MKPLRTTHTTYPNMSLCNVCASIPWRKFITGEQYEGTVELDGFRFNAAGRTSTAVSNEFSWNERRCTVAEIVSRAKTCSLCAHILLMIKRNKWRMRFGDWGTMATWEEIKTHIPRNLMVWIDLPDRWRNQKRIIVSLGNPHRRETWELNFHLRLGFGKFDIGFDTKMPH